MCVCVSGGLANREDEGGQLHSVLDARRHATERKGVHHEGVQIRSQVDQDHSQTTFRPGTQSDHIETGETVGPHLDRGHSRTTFRPGTQSDHIQTGTTVPCVMRVYSVFSRVLISTDVWARGLDVPQVSLIINYDLPNNRELYIHRCVPSHKVDLTESCASTGAYPSTL